MTKAIKVLTLSLFMTFLFASSGFSGDDGYARNAQIRSDISNLSRKLKRDIHYFVFRFGTELGDQGKALGDDLERKTKSFHSAWQNFDKDYRSVELTFYDMDEAFFEVLKICQIIRLLT